MARNGETIQNVGEKHEIGLENWGRPWTVANNNNNNNSRFCNNRSVMTFTESH